MADYGEVLRDFGVDTSDKQEVMDALKQSHGDIEDGKAAFLFIADEEDFRVEAEDIEAITDEPPTETFT